ncbi:MAG: hypothetical protein AB1543_07920 [Candidatus Bipolaricaulota bacterium]
MTRAALALTAVALICGLSAGAEIDWKYFGMYAPIVEYNTLTVSERPKEFPGVGEPTGMWTYVHSLKDSSGYTLQYWFYYRRDIRLSPEVDREIRRILEGVNQQYIKREDFAKGINKLFLNRPGIAGGQGA